VIDKKNNFLYRPEIDGLRAIAIISVIIFHIDQNILKGGFLGVDIFFVVSGYLITSILYNDLINNQFSFKKFYIHRITRLVPMISITLFMTVILSVIFMIPSEIIKYSESLFFSSIFFSNIYFWREDGYFRDIDLEKPLLHFWSLSIEEQFYILFPLMIFLLFRYKQNIYIYIIFFLLLSFLINIFSDLNSDIGNEAIFYLLPTRGWEILLGSLCALIKFKINLKKSLFSYAGFILIIMSFFFVDSNYTIPSQYILPVVLGTSMIILFTSKDDILGQILSHKILVKIGLISFSLYLIHHPVFAFIRIYDFDNKLNFLLPASLLLIFPLSFLTWKYIEIPTRLKFRDNYSFYNPINLLLIFLISFSIIFYFFVNKTNGLNYKNTDILEQKLLLLNIKEEGSYVKENFTNNLLKEFNDNELPNLLIIGDSFAMDFVNMIFENKLIDDRAEISTFHISRSCGNLYLDKNEISKFISQSNLKRCKDQNRFNNKKLLNNLNHADYVFLVSSWKEWLLPILPQSLERITEKTNAEIYIVGPKNFGNLSVKHILNLPNDQREINQFPIRDSLKKINIQLDELFDNYINIQNIICIDKDYCQIIHNGKLLTYDGSHLTKYGAKYLGSMIFNKNYKLNSIFK
tara:strand:- start:302 stop:2200 length:1899 start_codon:yes stop_codon:yes gene_type:complete